MFVLKRWFEDNLEVYEVSDPGGTAVRIVPARGGIVAEFSCWGVPVFYLDKDTLRNPGQNVRGGNPVLFPICGPLENGQYTLTGEREYAMKQHGLARNMNWHVVDVECGPDSSRITLECGSNEESIRGYPFEFRLVFTYVVEPGRLTIEQTYHNNSSEAMPFYAGFHPYFLAPGLKAAGLNIPARFYVDLKNGETRPFDGNLELDRYPETNLVFGDLSGCETGFDRSDGWRVTVKFDDNFRYIVLWALRNKEFLCLEPWMGDNYDLNRGLARLLAPGRSLSAVVSYCLQKIK